MISISQDFAPPFKLVAPYFIIGTFIFVLASLLTLNIDVTNLFHLDGFILSWVHLFLLGFVMMVIFGAMAQLIPVTLEVGHFSVEFYYIIWPLLFVGTLLMAVGFYANPLLLPYSGMIVLIAMFIFLAEVFLTLLKVKQLNNVIKSLIVSNIFLLLGICVGIVLALTYAGSIETDIQALLKAHVFLVLAGYITITIMALSLVLLPMFGLSHDFSQTPLNIAIILMSLGVSLIFIANVVGIEFLNLCGYALALVSMTLYCYQVYLIYTTRARKENDIYVINLFYAMASLCFALISLIIHFITSNESWLLAGGWLLFMGFFSFIIIGHLYKIVPFLVWFERFSPLVGKQKVPMLADMVPVRAANYQFNFTALGVSLCALALIVGSNILFKAGASFLIIGAIFLFKNLLYMIRFK